MTLTRMSVLATLFCVPLIVSACATKVIVKEVPATIDPALLRPVAHPVLKCDTEGCVGQLIAEQNAAIRSANGQIRAIAETLDKQKKVQ